MWSNPTTFGFLAALAAPTLLRGRDPSNDKSLRAHHTRVCDPSPHMGTAGEGDDVHHDGRHARGGTLTEPEARGSVRQRERAGRRRLAWARLG